MRPHKRPWLPHAFSLFPPQCSFAVIGAKLISPSDGFSPIPYPKRKALSPTPTTKTMVIIRSSLPPLAAV